MIETMTSGQLSSPPLSNDLVGLDLRHYYPDQLDEIRLDDIITTLCTQRILPGDETSPLKFGNLRKLDLRGKTVSEDVIELAIKTLSQLTHLTLPKNATDRTIDTLVAIERDQGLNLTHLDISRSTIADNTITIIEST